MIKSIIIKISAILFLYLFVTASKVEVPEIVINAFENSYKNAESVKWEKQWENYKVFFEIDNLKNEVLYKADGNMIYLKTETFFDAVPDIVMNSFQNSKYAGNNIESIKKVIKDKLPYYEFEIELFKFKKLIYFDKLGELVDLKLE